MNEPTLTRGLSIYSLGLGLTELFAPRVIARLVGLDDRHDTLIRLLGLREISSGLGLMQTKSAACHWSRVAGDALDFALLSAARRSPHHDRQRLSVALAAVAGLTVIDFFTAIASTHSAALAARTYRPGASDDEDFQLPLGLHRDSADPASVEPDFGELVRPAGAPDFPQSAPI